MSLKNRTGNISFQASALLMIIIVITGVSIYGFSDLHAEEKASASPNNKEDIDTISAPIESEAARKKGVKNAKSEVKSNKDPKILYVKVPVGRIRQEASIHAGITSLLYKGERVTVIESSGNWYRINTENGRQGWAHNLLFSKDEPRSRSGTKHLIRAIRVEALSQERGKVFIELDGYYLPKTLVLEGDRPRVACDFYGFRPDPNLQKTMSIDTGIIRSIRLGVHGGGKAKTRIVIDLSPEHNYIIEQQFFIEENTYLLDIHLK